MMESFYVTLPSNIINNHSNKICNFTTTLPAALQLDSSWKVGLSEIHYTNSWFNLKTWNYVTLVDQLTYAPLAEAFRIAPGRYMEINKLLREISKSVTKVAGLSVLPAMEYDEPSQKFRMRPGKMTDETVVVYVFSEELASMLGVTNGYDGKNENEYAMATANRENGGSDIIETVIWSAVSWMLAKDCYDMNAGINSLYVYSDVVDYSIVGSVKAPLLRVVHIPPKSKFGDPVHIMYDRPYYLPLATKDIHEIEIAIRDDSGDLIDFKFGRVEVTLHFIKDG